MIKKKSPNPCLCLFLSHPLRRSAAASSLLQFAPSSPAALESLARVPAAPGAGQEREREDCMITATVNCKGSITRLYLRKKVLVVVAFLLPLLATATALLLSSAQVACFRASSTRYLSCHASPALPPPLVHLSTRVGRSRGERKRDLLPLSLSLPRLRSSPPHLLSVALPPSTRLPQLFPSLSLSSSLQASMRTR